MQLDTSRENGAGYGCGFWLLWLGFESPSDVLYRFLGLLKWIWIFFGAIVKYLFARDLLKRPLISPNGRNKSIIPTRTELCLFWRQTNSAVLRPSPGSLEWLITSAVMNVENFGEKPTNCETPIPENWGCRIEWNALQSAALSDFSS